MYKRMYTSEKTVGDIMSASFSPMIGKSKNRRRQQYLPINLRKY